MSRTTYVTLNHNREEEYIDVVNCTFSVVYRIYYKRDAWFALGDYVNDRFYEFNYDTQSEVSTLAMFSPTLSDYVATYLASQVVEVKPSLAAKYNTPSKVAQVWVAIANLCETLNADHAMIAIADYLDIPHQWCLDACDGLAEPYYLVGYILAELCPTDRHITDVRGYLPKAYWSFAPLESELPDEGGEDCQSLWDDEYRRVSG
ncbi:hypothetical protein [Leptolyngbya phage Lbo240-yong1]|uniref:Uncharacterized protein n=1 Tax=Leptolyngbya phage Lbo240-yong1 TaxID=2928836 RepID=A0A9X9H4U1_9CAUD|nr:hypothetical protein [Leptolyngbya phage Lbo240-yong1]